MVEDARPVPRQQRTDQGKLCLERPHIERERTAEFAERGGVAARLLRIPIALWRPAFGFGATDPPPLAGEVPSKRSAARRRGEKREPPLRLAASWRSTSPASGGG